MNKNGPHRLIHLNELSPGKWYCLKLEELKGVAVLEGVCHWRWALRFQNAKSGLVSRLPLPLHYCSSMCMPAAMCAAMMIMD